MIDCIGSCKGNIRLPGIMMLGYVAAHSENLAMAVIISKVGALHFSPVSTVRCSEARPHLIFFHRYHLLLIRAKEHPEKKKNPVSMLISMFIGKFSKAILEISEV